MAGHRNEVHPNDVDGIRSVVTVDEHDRPLGTAAVLAAHQHGGRRHRAFSVFLFDDDGRVLLQRRAESKPLFAGLWANTCCSHQGPGEATEDAALRRVGEELGMVAADPIEVGSFEYRAECTTGLVEHEIDHVVMARAITTEVRAEPTEIAETRWVTLAEFRSLLADRPEQFGPWVAPAAELVFEALIDD
ncbi:MAG: isopentenyl-diphosphate Delta-isomerase, partial [Actinomycetota bacterium]